MSPFSNFKLVVLESVYILYVSGVDLWLYRQQHQTGSTGQVSYRQTPTDTDRQVLSSQCGIGCQWRGWACAPDPRHRRSSSHPSISPPEGTRTASGLLAAMSSMLGVVRKQLKSHPAVSDRAARFRPRPRSRFRPRGAVTLRAWWRTRVRC